MHKNFFIFIMMMGIFLFEGCIAKPKVENKSYSGASFLHTNFTNSCASCHETKRPATTTHLNATGAAISSSPHYSSQDCVSCHTAGTTWKFSHSPAQSSCTTCHEIKRPAPVGIVPHGNGADCISCHDTKNWIGAAFAHDSSITSCVSCHETKRPTTTKHLNTAGVAVVSSPHYTPRDCIDCHKAGMTWTFSHSPAPSSCTTCHEIKRPTVVNGVAHVATGDCKGCHNITNWTATYNHTPAPTSCVSCHETTRPATQSHLNTLGVKVVTTPHYIPQDCVVCHTPSSGTAILPAAWSFKHNPAQATCSSCHEVKRPVAPHVATGDCVSCHTIQNWIGTYNHTPTPTSCVSCHTKDRPTVNPGHNSKVTRHYSTVAECKSCHTAPVTSSATTWKSGSSLTCVLCHLAKGQSEHGITNTQVGGRNYNCANCHSPLRTSW